MSGNKAAPVVTAAVAAAAAAGATALLFLAWNGGGQGAALPPAPPPRELDEVRAELATLRESLQQLARRLSATEVGAARTAAPVASAELERLVRQILEEQGIAVDKGAKPAAAGSEPRAEVYGILQELRAPGPMAKSDELWERIRRLGAADEAVENFEQWVRANPGSPDAHTGLGMAYIQKMLSVQDDAERAELGKKIDECFDHALELEPDHWEARYRKAVGLTYAPPLSGRQDEAIGHFERLVEQQRSMPARPEQADAYLYLGRLYEQRGQHDRAAEIWRQGTARHPTNAELAELARRLAGSGR